MREFLFNQLKAVRGDTINVVKELSESQADSIPEGFNNNIRWNLGHVYVVQELFAFAFINFFNFLAHTLHLKSSPIFSLIHRS